MIHQQRADELSGNDGRKEQCGPQAADQQDRGEHDDGAQQPAGPNPPRGGTELCRGGPLGTHRDLVKEQAAAERLNCKRCPATPFRFYDHVYQTCPFGERRGEH